MEGANARKRVSYSSSSDSSGSDAERRISKKRRRDKKKRKEEVKRKEKKKHLKSRKHRSSSEGSSEAEERHRKKRRHSSSSSDRSSDEEERSKKKRLLKEAKRIIKSHKKEKSDAGRESFSQSATQKILTDDDYYEKNKEFSTWLRDEHGLYFSNLSAVDARRLFKDFVHDWNSGKLSQRIYNGIQSTSRTDHKWHIKGGDESYVDKEEELEFTKKLEKIQRKKFQKDQKDLIDELLPQATGRERLIEKKMIRKEATRLREESPELLRDEDIMGGSDDFKQRLERERARREKKIMEKEAALREKKLASDERETAAMDQFKALVNLSGGTITIPKRAQ
ncbi:hypothetical protein KP509_34G032300 [Ceratopteris richardii]|uniref:Uncharacterized protein n=1 Tax=Ceratopteris richardii TaxID=49495 RepID=A0A8T2QKL3_CERRI|nr:hypothetical protein KP509_34G032300 [Ceratopteris richardii]